MHQNHKIKKLEHTYIRKYEKLALKGSKSTEINVLIDEGITEIKIPAKLSTTGNDRGQNSHRVSKRWSWG